MAIGMPRRKIVYAATPSLSEAAFQSSATLVFDVAWAVRPPGVAGTCPSPETASRDTSSTWKLSPERDGAACTIRSAIRSPFFPARWRTSGNARQRRGAVGPGGRGGARAPAGGAPGGFRHTPPPRGAEGADAPPPEGPAAPGRG